MNEKVHGNTGYKYRLTHGLSGTRLRAKWANMKRRCDQPSHKQFNYYCQLGYYSDWVKFDPWLKYVTELSSFPGFEAVEDEDWHIHRIDNNIGYFPENLEWVTQQQHIKIHKSE